MKSTASRLASMLLASSFLLGCTAMMASSLSLQGDWSLKEIRGEKALILAATDGPFTLSLHPSEQTDGQLRATGKVACNGWHAETQQSGDTLQLGSAGSTRMRCIIKDSALRSLERRYLTTLQTPAKVTVSDAELQLRFGSGETWIFQRQSR